MAEPVSNVIGGGICFVTMLCTVLPGLRGWRKSKVSYVCLTLIKFNHQKAD